VEALDIIAVEQEICRLPEVSAVRIVSGGIDERLTEIHVVALPGKAPKQIVRDIQSVTFAAFGLEIDRRIVSVVQFSDPDAVDGPAPRRAFRPAIAGTTAEQTGLRLEVRVTLESDGETATGFAEGSIARVARHRLTALATLDALRQLEPLAAQLDIESAQVVRAGTTDVAIATVVFVQPPTEDVIAGSAIVRQHQEGDAVVRAVLDATNRRLGQITA
jgi:hypothetical protein